MAEKRLLKPRRVDKARVLVLVKADSEAMNSGVRRAAADVDGVLLLQRLLY